MSKATPYKTLSSRNFKKTPWSVFKHDVFLTPEGKKGDYFYHHSNGAVFIIPVLADGKIVLIKQYRYLFQRSDSIEFPGGGAEKGQSFEKSAVRELLEETGFLAGKLIKIGLFSSCNGVTDEVTRVFIASKLVKKKAKPEELEIIRTFYRSFDQIEEMIKQNKIWDGQTLASWALARPALIKLLKEKTE
jgi:ADP-ribose pyrophosphatase